MYDIHTRTRYFCKICTPVPQYPGYGYNIFISARNFRKLCMPVPQYPELLEVLYDLHTRTRNFCEFCTIFIPAPGTSVGSVRYSYPHPELLWVLHDIHTRTRNFCDLCTPRATISGVRVQHFLYPPGTSVRFVHRATIPGTSVSSVTLPYPYPNLLEVL